MKKKGQDFLVFLCFFLLVSFVAHAQTTEIRGKVISLEGEALPGAEVTLTSPNLIGGNQIKITDLEGKFRFVALLPGTYAVEARLQGFTPQRRSDLRLSQGKTLTVEMVLEIGTLQESIEVIGQAPIIDLKDSQTVTTNFKKEFLQKLPNRGVGGALDMTPGVSDESAFGSARSNSTNYMVQGVKINSPEGGESGMSLEYDSIEEISVMGVGAPAEYGGFSGAVVNSVMKSGGNDFHGLATFYMTHPSIRDENWDKYPDLESFRYPSESYEANFNVGGPIIKDKLWFFTSGRWGYIQRHYADYEGPTEGNRPWRIAGKLTWQPSRNDRLSAWAAFDKDKIINYGYEPDWMAPECNTNENHRNILWNSNYLHMFSDVTFLEVKFGGFRNLANNDVDKDTSPPPHYDVEEDMLYGSYPWTYYRHSLRVQTNIALSHHAEDFIAGDHDFKIGAEIEYSKVTISYYYPQDRYYFDYGGEPAYFFEWEGYAGKPKMTTISGFVQDSWTISDRLVINPGLRINHWRGWVPGVSGPALAPKMGIAPRIGITYDVFGDNSTAIKAHYGKYYHGLFGQMFFRLDPNYDSSFFLYLWGPVYDEWEELPEGTHGEEWYLYDTEVWENEYTIDENIKNAYMNQYVIGIERELGKDVSVGASFIYKTNHDMQDRVNLTGEWEAVQWTCPYEGTPFYGKTYTVYERLNPRDNQYLITNPKGGEDYGTAFPDIVAFTPTRKYRGIQFTFEKRYSNGWMLNASYTWGKAWGTDDNEFYDWSTGRGSMFGGGTMYSNPNYQINAEGPLSIDPTHLLKIFGAVDIPVVDVTLGLYYHFTSGSPYSSNLILPQEIDEDSTSWDERVFIFGEERGTYRYPGMHTFDLRLEKFFRIGEVRVGVLADVFNALNDDAEDWYHEYVDPRSWRQFQDVRGIRGARRFRLGLRFEF